MHLRYILKPVTLELLCKCKIDLNQFTIIAVPPSRWGEGGVNWLHPLTGVEKTMFTDSHVVVQAGNGCGVKLGRVEGMVKSSQFL